MLLFAFSLTMSVSDVSAETEHCPSGGTKLEGNYNSTVLPAGTQFCVKASTETVSGTADGSTSLIGYVQAAGIVNDQGNPHDVSYYVVYASPSPTSVPPTAVPPTAVPPTAVPPTSVPPTAPSVDETVMPTTVPNLPAPTESSEAPKATSAPVTTGSDQTPPTPAAEQVKVLPGTGTGSGSGSDDIGIGEWLLIASTMVVAGVLLLGAVRVNRR